MHSFHSNHMFWIQYWNKKRGVDLVFFLFIFLSNESPFKAAKDIRSGFNLSGAKSASACLATCHNFYFLCFQFAEKFQEVKDAAKLAKDKSQEKGDTLSNHSQVKNLSAARETPPCKQPIATQKLLTQRQKGEHYLEILCNDLLSRNLDFLFIKSSGSSDKMIGGISFSGLSICCLPSSQAGSESRW